MWQGIVLICILMGDFTIRVPELPQKPSCSLTSNIITQGVKVSDFLETAPRDSASPEVGTQAYLGTYNQTLYILVVCEENDRIRAKARKKDDLMGLNDDDGVQLVIDPDNSGTREYLFMTNPVGSTVDLLYTSGTTYPNYNFDWLAYTEQQGDTLWLALFEIPLRVFTSIKRDKFRLSILRTRAKDGGITYSWPPIPEQSPRDPYATLVLTSGVKGFSLGLIPYGLSYVFSPMSVKKTCLRGGVTAYYSMEKKLNILMAYRPDFTTVEADEPQLTVNNPFALYYSENRPIFLENGDVFQRNDYETYTRRIKYPLGVLKVVGKFKNTEFGSITAYDLYSTEILATHMGSFEGEEVESAWVNLTTFRHYFDKGNYLGFVCGMKDGRLKNSYVGFFEGGFNYNERLLGNGVFGYSKSDSTGKLFNFSLSYKFKNITPFLSYFGISPDFENPVGFVKASDIGILTGGVNVHFPIAKEFLKLGQFSLSYSRRGYYPADFYGDSLNANLMLIFKYRTSIVATYSNVDMEFPLGPITSSLKNLDMFSIVLMTSPVDFGRITLGFATGEVPNYTVFTLQKANYNSGSMNGELFLGKKNSLSFTYRVYTLRDNEAEIASQKVYYLKYLFNASKSTSFRFISSYDGEKFLFSPLLSVELGPYSSLYFGGSATGLGNVLKFKKSVFLKIQAMLDLL